jgi:excinuclease UvrABC nuclease subunit
MVLSPSHWDGCPLQHQLQWRSAKFDKANATQVPKDRCGVYSFLVLPGVAQHAACAYLMYVGKAEKQSLRARFEQYFEHLTETSRRTNISKMLRLWRNHLWFYYAPVADITKIDGTEQALLNAFLPPFNRRYRGMVAKQLRHLFS